MAKRGRKKKTIKEKKVETIQEKINDIAPDDSDVYDERYPYGRP